MRGALVEGGRETLGKDSALRMRVYSVHVE